MDSVTASSERETGCSWDMADRPAQNRGCDGPVGPPTVYPFWIGVEMSVLCEALSVIVPVRRLAEAFPGGLAGYRDRVPNRTFCEDGQLTRVGFMASDDVGAWISLLQSESRLVPSRGQIWIDLAVVDQFNGPTAPCEWLEFDRDAERSRAWLRGAPPGETAVPVGWKPTQLAFHPGEEVGGMPMLRSSNGLESTIDPDTGSVQFVRRGVVAEARLEEVWADLLTDEETFTGVSTDWLLCVISADFRASPVVMFDRDSDPVEALQEIAADVRRDGAWFAVRRGSLPQAVGLAAFGELGVLVSAAGGDERCVPMLGNFVLSIDAIGSPRAMIHPPGSERIASSRKPPKGTADVYDALADFLEALEARAV